MKRAQQWNSLSLNIAYFEWNTGLVLNIVPNHKTVFERALEIRGWISVKTGRKESKQFCRSIVKNVAVSTDYFLVEI